MPEFLSAVSPQIVIISAGEENPYGHPSPELLQRLEEGGLHIFRTDQERRRAGAHRRSQSERALLCGLPGVRNPIRPRAGAR
jgi:hypothetical protein